MSCTDVCVGLWPTKYIGLRLEELYKTRPEDMWKDYLAIGGSKV